MEEEVKKVNTVKGSIDVEELGLTLIHEHIFNNYPYYKEQENTDFALKQLNLLKKFNVKTIVDLTPYAKFSPYKNLIENCNDFNIISSVGFYLDKFVPKQYKIDNVETLVNKLSKKIECGVGSEKCRPGVIKIAAKNESLSRNELKFFEVASILQQKYNIPIATHSPKGALNHIKTLINFGADPNHIYLSHLENSFNEENFNNSMNNMIKVTQTGASILLSNFGFNENGKRCINSADIAKYLKDYGYLNKILISADSYWLWKNNQIKIREQRKNQKVEKNILYTFNYIIPALRKLNFSEEDIHEILYVNPYNIFN